MEKVFHVFRFKGVGKLPHMGWVAGGKKEAEKVKGTTHTEQNIFHLCTGISVVMGQVFVGWDRPERRSFLNISRHVFPSSIHRIYIARPDVPEFFMTFTFVARRLEVVSAMSAAMASRER